MVHPHVRGELGLQLPYMWLSPGSSPRAWGTLPHGVHQVVSERFIPRCVGNSVNRTHRLRVSVVHPHVRGELLVFHLPILLCLWFIPTCVGNSGATSTWPATCSVHPQVRGELVSDSVEYDQFYGSSPRAWGTRFPESSQYPAVRFIPTCVGNSSEVRPSSLL